MKIYNEMFNSTVTGDNTQKGVKVTIDWIDKKIFLNLDIVITEFSKGYASNESLPHLGVRMVLKEVKRKNQKVFNDLINIVQPKLQAITDQYQLELDQKNDEMVFRPSEKLVKLLFNINK
jgi:hypothetical protein